MVFSPSSIFTRFRLVFRYKLNPSQFRIWERSHPHRLIHFTTVARSFMLNMGKKGKNKGSNNQKPSLQKIPASINLVVIGTGGPGTSKCLLLTTEYSRYMFNCGEGSQRLTVMNKCLKSVAYAKISGLENIFITHKSWENTGGLLGTAMLVEGQKNPEVKNFLQHGHKKLKVEENVESSQSQGSLPELTLYGPHDIEKITMMARKFSERSNMNIVRKEGVFEDVAIKVTPVVFHKEDSSSLAEKHGDKMESATTPPRASTTDAEQGQTYAYICSAFPPPGKINVEKCVDAGITMGPMVGELQRGNAVTLPDGTVVRPEQVIDLPESSPNSFVVVECPSHAHFPSLTASEQLNQYRGQDRSESLAVVVHMTPAHVLNSQDYQQWMASFGEETDHLVMNEEAIPADLSRVRQHQAQLNAVSASVFPLLPKITQGQTVDFSTNQKPRVVKACSGLVYTLRGKNLGFHIETDDIDIETLQSEVMTIPEVKTELDLLNKDMPDSVAPKENEQNGDGPCPRVVFLGTGSSEPNKIRAQSCICVHLSEDSMVVLDCGEDSFGQFFRFHGEENAWRVLLKLKAIFVSHMHGDHHLGLLTFLKERKKAFDYHAVPFVPVILMAPVQMKRWLKFYHCEVEEVVHLYRFHRHQRELKEFDDQFKMNAATDEDVQSSLGVTEYKTVDVIHARNSFGVAFTHQSGFKLAYSGDTRPCDALVEAGQNCDLLIHEATHEDDLLQHAKVSKHSTFSEAMEVGERMNAKHIILTHFSQRYPHMVPFFGMSVPSNVGIAFDNMQVTENTLPLLHKFISPFMHIFADKIQRLEIKSLKRSREQAKLDEL